MEMGVYYYCVVLKYVYYLVYVVGVVDKEWSFYVQERLEVFVG